MQTILFSFSARSFSSETSSVSIARVNEANVEDVLDFQPEHYVRTFRQFLRQGDVGYYAYVDGRCCHRSWVQRGPRWVDINPFVQMKLEKNEACIHYCETAPWARGKSIYPSVLSRIAEDHRGYGDLFICVDSQNTASIRGVEKAGFRERERVEVRRVLKISLYRVSASSLLLKGSRRSYRAFWPLAMRLLALCRRRLAKALRGEKT